MNGHGLQQLERLVRDANPVPQVSTLVGSEESAAVTRLLSRLHEMDVPELLPSVPASPLRPFEAEDLLERGRDMDTQERTHVQDATQPLPTVRPRRWRTIALGFAAVVVIGALAGIGWMVFDDSESPPAGPAPEIAFDDPDEKLAAHRTTITGLIEETYARAATQLDVGDIRFTVSPDIFGAVPYDYAVGAMFADIDSLVIAIDPWFPELAEALPDQVPPQVAGALYEMARWRSLEVAEVTLLEDLVLLGLGAHFAEELLGTPTLPWFDAFPASQTEEIMNMARPVLDSTDYDISHWFHGNKTEIPLWAGYTLGYRLIETYLADNPGLTAIDLVDTPAFVFRPPIPTDGD